MVYRTFAVGVWRALCKSTIWSLQFSCKTTLADCGFSAVTKPFASTHISSARSRGTAGLRHAVVNEAVRLVGSPRLKAKLDTWMVRSIQDNLNTQCQCPWVAWSCTVDTVHASSRAWTWSRKSHLTTVNADGGPFRIRDLMCFCFSRFGCE